MQVMCVVRSRVSLNGATGVMPGISPLGKKREAEMLSTGEARTGAGIRSVAGRAHLNGAPPAQSPLTLAPSGRRTFAHSLAGSRETCAGAHAWERGGGGGEKGQIGTGE